MKSFYSKILFGLFLILFTLNSKAQKTKNIHYTVSVNSAISSDETLPFWLVSNKNGTVPNSNFGSVNTSIFSNFKKSDKDFGIAYKLNATGFIGNENNFTGYIADGNQLLINEIYVRLQYKKWALVIGNKNDDINWEGLSSTNGNIVKSVNSRAYPGINFKTLEYLKLPFAKNWLSFQLNFSNYWLNDKRYVDNTNLHHASLFFKSKLSPKFELITGLDHYVQWGGTSSVTGAQPNSFKDFTRIVLGKSGDTSTSDGDQQNALGNHLGAYLIQLNYLGKNTHLNFYYSHPFEDGSGMELQNWKDGLYGLMIDLKQPKAAISHILTEFTYTKNMSGENPSDRGYDENGIKLSGRGHDNYFNSLIYGSGWTYFGRSIGSPYFTTKPVNENGITEGVISGDNRFMSFNIGLKGTLKPIHYKVMLSHVTYFGWFNQEYDPKPKQFSGFLEMTLPEKEKGLPFNISASVAFDTGTYTPVNYGGMITISKNGFF